MDGTREVYAADRSGADAAHAAGRPLITEPELYAYLARLGVNYQRCDHAPVHTCSEAAQTLPALAGAPTKNLFLRDRRGRQHLLLVLRPEQIIDLHALGQQIGMSGLGMASPRRLAQHLGVSPGAVSLLALVNDVQNLVQVVIDDVLWRSAAFQCHPLINTATLVVGRADLLTVLASTGHDVRVLRLPPRAMRA